MFMVEPLSMGEVSGRRVASRPGRRSGRRRRDHSVTIPDDEPAGEDVDQVGGLSPAALDLSARVGLSYAPTIASAPGS